MNPREKRKEQYIMRYRHNGSRDALEVKVHYVESKLDDTIKDFRQAMDKWDSKHEESLKSLKKKF